MSIIIVVDCIALDRTSAGCRQCERCRGKSQSAANPNIAVVVYIVVENLHPVLNAHASRMVKRDFVVLDCPICSLRKRFHTLGGTDSSMWIHTRKFFDREVLNNDVVGTSTESVGGHAGLDRVAGRVVVEVDDMIRVIEPPLAGADVWQCGRVQVPIRPTIEK